MIYLASFFDGLMALLLIGIYFKFRKSLAMTKNSVAEANEVRIRETA